MKDSSRPARTAIWCFTPRESLVTALSYMTREDFSQIVVRDDGRLTLLTVEGIAGWLGAQVAASGVVTLDGATVGDALHYELLGNALVVSRNTHLREARRFFESAIEHGRPRLYGLIITETGSDDEPPLGIVTPWDLLGDGPVT